MRGFIVLIVLVFITSCASGPTNKTSQKEIDLTGGLFERKSWDDSMTFKRTSWYIGATLSYDIWLAKIDKSSPFTNWMENNKEANSECREFFVGLIYSNNASTLVNLQSVANIKKQITELGYEEVTLSNFKSHLATHDVYQQWHLRNHRLAGFCYKKMSSIPEEIPVSLPGFRTINIIKNQ